MVERLHMGQVRLPCIRKQSNAALRFSLGEPLRKATSATIIASETEDLNGYNQ
ncbi:MAG: hypothetical protein HDQ99_22330 [Lachnospiraceae bacterium]|nr:hypothetical protein [Lachnospiraceae bacterium]MBD5538327.1 hypothetical protein [Lachnospiraceae bacterium]